MCFHSIRALTISLSSSEFFIDDGLDESFVTSSSILSSDSSLSLSVGIDILDKGELCKAVDLFLIAGVALAGENWVWKVNLYLSE
jgi:hypothetical protein